MLNIFPIQFLAPLAYFILRIALGAFFIKKSARMWNMPQTSASTRFIAGIQAIVGVMMMLGFLTQVAAMLGMLIAVLAVLFKKSAFFPPYDKATALFIFAISLSLFITGAGPFGFDLPI